jgi:hypothetical protein
VDTVACLESTRGERWSQRSRPDWIRSPAMSRLGCRVGWWTCLRLGVGHASTVRPDLSTLGVVGELRGPLAARRRLTSLGRGRRRAR